MPPRARSRHIFTLGVNDTAEPDKLQLTDREPFLFQDLPDNRMHLVGDGDTYHSLAARYFDPIESAANLWWIICDFQPEPVHDPTIALVPGTTLVIPSVRTVFEAIFADKRALEGG